MQSGDRDTRIDDKLRKEAERTIRRRFGTTASKFEIVSMEVDEDISEVRIVVAIETSATPEVLADNYYGLTGRVRDTLGHEWRNFFPIVTPNIARVEHA